jgi:hypothetical protein
VFTNAFLERSLTIETFTFNFLATQHIRLPQRLDWRFTTCALDDLVGSRFESRLRTLEGPRYSHELRHTVFGRLQFSYLGYKKHWYGMDLFSSIIQVVFYWHFASCFLAFGKRDLLDCCILSSQDILELDVLGGSIFCIRRLYINLIGG